MDTMDETTEKIGMEKRNIVEAPRTPQAEEKVADDALTKQAEELFVKKD